MKKSTIKKILSSRFESWLGTFEDEDLRERVRHNSIVTGGCITSMLLDEEINDIDVYITCPSTLFDYVKREIGRWNDFNSVSTKVKDVHQRKDGSVYLEFVDPSEGVGKIGLDGRYEDEGKTNNDSSASFLDFDIEGFEAPENFNLEYFPIYLSQNAIYLRGDIQITMRFTNSIEEIHDKFDFVHATNYWLPGTNELHLNPEAVESILTKSLKFKQSQFPIAALMRVRKFIERGWTINAGEMFKIVLSIYELDLFDFEEDIIYRVNLPELENQLQGVDVSYFAHLIQKFKDGRITKRSDMMNYLSEIFDS